MSAMIDIFMSASWLIIDVYCGQRMCLLCLLQPQLVGISPEILVFHLACFLVEDTKLAPPPGTCLLEFWTFSWSTPTQRAKLTLSLI